MVSITDASPQMPKSVLKNSNCCVVEIILTSASEAAVETFIKNNFLTKVISIRKQPA